MSKSINSINAMGITLVLLPLICSFSFREPCLQPKWFVIYVTVLIILLATALKKANFSIPNIPAKGRIIFYILLLALGFNYIFHSIPLLSIGTLDRISFAVVFLFFYQVFRKRYNFQVLLTPLFIGHTIFLAFSYSQLLFLDPLMPGGKIMAGFLGNINMGAEWTGIALFFILYSYPRIHTFYGRMSVFYKAWILVLGSLSFAYLYWSVCRSVGIGVCLGFIFLISQKQFLSWRPFLSMIAGAILSLLPIYAFLTIPPEKAENIYHLGVLRLLGGEGVDRYYPKGDLNFRRKAHGQRIVLIENAFSTWLDNPFGIGMGRYEFGVMPYQKGLAHTEQFTHTSPHSDPLRILLEDGAHTMFIGLALFAYLLWFYRKKIKKRLNNPTFSYSVALALYLGVEALIQFPLEVPTSFFYWSICLAALFAGVVPSRKQRFLPAPTIRSALISCFAMLFFLASFLHVYTQFKVFSTKTDYSDLLFSTRLFPNNAPAWQKLVFMDAERDNTTAFSHAFKALSYSPYNFVLLRELIYLFNVAGDHYGMCLSMHLYDQYFHHKSSVSEAYKKICGKNAVWHDNSPQKNYEDVISHLKKYVT